ncbi:MAG: L,D-transpeptidase family protein [Campylobacterales bacterium]|nr:L,D-transpeptidase family protein [Campylobacterales bacterium]
MKKAFVLLALLYSVTEAQDLVQIYKNQGLSEVKKMLDLQLQDKQYWEKYLQNINTNNGYYESIEYVMLCQKNLNDLTLYKNDDFKTIFHSNVITGQNNGDKQQEGDLKTPVGAYKITQRLTKLDSYYGPLALTTNYPNLYDQVQGKTGHGIWIHGVPEKQEREQYTKGCIALDNDSIQKLDNSINIENSILIISEKQFQSPSKSDLARILSDIYQWKDAWANNNLEKYLSFYNPNFVKANGQNLQKFKEYKQSIFDRKQSKIIRFYNINIIPYPNNQNKPLYKIYMDEYYYSNSHKFTGKKELYIELLDDKISIITES